MSILNALILGAVQGLTEFIPVSSTAHLYLAQWLLGIANNSLALSFDIVLHLGTALALVLATRRQLTGILVEVWRSSVRQPPLDPVARALVWPLVVGTIPGVLAGLFLLRKFEDLRTVALIGISMLVACGYFLLAERLAEKAAAPPRDLARVSLADALWIGLAQAAAGLMAGLSRSGFTISTGRLRGMRREDSARFSFLLALPIIVGGGAKAILDLRRWHGPSIGLPALATGFLASAIVGYFAVGLLLKFVKTHTLKPFALYLGLLGLVLLAVSFSLHLPLVERPSR